MELPVFGVELMMQAGTDLIFVDATGRDLASLSMGPFVFVLVLVPV